MIIHSSVPSVPSLSLRDAVLSQIQEFINNQTPFSRYDITTALRNRCNNGELEIPEVATQGSNVKYMIMKNDVDRMFDDIYQNPSAYGIPSLRSTFKPGFAYRIFEVDSSVAPSTPATPSTPYVSSGYVSTPIGSPPPPTSAQVSPPATDSEIRRRIQTYLTRCAAGGNTPSLKKIQSAIKRGNKSTGLSCNDIRNIATSLGYTV